MITFPDQKTVREWIEYIFKEDFEQNTLERACRFLEEALEAVQSAGLSQKQAHNLVGYVFSRPVDPDIGKELGGAVITALALAEATGVSLGRAVREEFERFVGGEVEAAREKHADKPDKIKGSYEEINHRPYSGADGVVLHGCEMCNGEDICTCPKNLRAVCLGCGGRWPECAEEEKEK